MADLRNFLTFRLSVEEFAIDISEVQEIRIWEEPTPMPNFPDFVAGVLDLRGEVVPIVDLRKRFKLPAAITPTTVVMVVSALVDNGRRTVGLVADAVSDVYELDLDTLQKSAGVASMDSKYIRGLAKIPGDMGGKDRMVIVVNLDELVGSGLSKSSSLNKVLSAKDILELDKPASGAKTPDQTAPSVEDMKRRMMG